MTGPYRDRVQAGQILAHALEAFRGWQHTLVLGLPRGGMPVAFEVAEALGLPLDACVVRKVGLPGDAECAMGALVPGHAPVLDAEVIAAHHVGPDAIAQAVRREEREARRRESVYRAGLPPLCVAGLTVILVDDGLATGATLRAALQALREQGPKAIIVAVPVAPPEACAALSEIVDLLVCPRRPADFSAVGAWYEDFRPTSDEEVCALLASGRAQYSV